MPRILVANRGEIACRVLRAARERGLETVAVFSPDDADAPHVLAADRALSLGPDPSPAASYGSIPAILAAAATSGADAVHPGYGFLAEKGDFADAVEAAGLVFVGPRGDTLRLLGDKVAALVQAHLSGLPTLPRSPVLASLDEALTAAASLGYPVMLKSPAGGGGLACHRAHDEASLRSAWTVAGSQASALYGCPDLFLERFLSSARHIEVQALGNGEGGVVTVGTRECSVQRRRQKLVEECPAPRLADGLPERLRAAAVSLLSGLKLRSAATVEFLVSGDGFFFLEVNPRIQVEHPVTELVHGVDLVGEQLALALDGALTIDAEPAPRGCALEMRIYAEEPRGFTPAPGRVDRFIPPTGPGIRVDAGVAEGSVVSPRYDPLLAKLSVWAEDRPRALRRAALALRDFVVAGTLTTNVPALLAVLTSDWFAEGSYDTGTLERWLGDAELRGEAEELAGLIGLASRPINSPSSSPSPSHWRSPGWRTLP